MGQRLIVSRKALVIFSVLNISIALLGCATAYRSQLLFCDNPVGAMRPNRSAIPAMDLFFKKQVDDYNEIGRTHCGWKPK